MQVKSTMLCRAGLDFPGIEVYIGSLTKQCSQYEQRMTIVERKERDRRHMKTRILDAAMKLFRERGYDHVSMRTIAAEIEYSPATLYLHFKDKDDILFALHTRGFDELYKRQQATDRIRDPLKRLRKHGEAYLAFALEHPVYYDFMFIMRGPGRKIKEHRSWDAGMRTYDLLRKHVRACVESGVFPRADVDAATFGLWSFVHGIASIVIRSRTAMIPDDRLPHLINGALDFLEALMKRPAPHGAQRRVR